MNSMVNYLTTAPVMEAAVLLLGEESSPNLVVDIFRALNLKTLQICAYHSAQEEEIKKLLDIFREDRSVAFPSEICFVSHDDIFRLSRDTSAVLGLLFDSLTDLSVLESLHKLSPDYLCGTWKAEHEAAFSLWEIFRDVCEEMYLLTWIPGRREQALQWKRNPSNDIELSVIFPMYNVAAYLPKCLETVTAWKAPYIEFLFVDDGSPDQCAQIIRNAAETDPRIHLLQKENGGCASARQYGLDYAKGRYVGFIDPDDYIDPSMFKKLLSRAMVGSYEISYCGYKELYEESGLTQEIEDVLGEPYCSGTSVPEEIYPLIAYRRIAIWRGIYLKEMLDRNGIGFHEDIRRFDDLPFKAETLGVAKSVVCVPEYLYYYRMSRPGQDVSADDERLYVHFQIFKYLDSFASKKGNKEITDYLQIVKLQTHIWALGKIRPEYVAPYLKEARKDLLANMSFGDCCLVYRHGVGRQEKKWFLAITLFGPLMVKRLKNAEKKKAEKKIVEKESLRKKLKGDL